jgi:hypothetical protein
MIAEREKQSRQRAARSRAESPGSAPLSRPRNSRSCWTAWLTYIGSTRSFRSCVSLRPLRRKNASFQTKRRLRPAIAGVAPASVFPEAGHGMENLRSCGPKRVSFRLLLRVHTMSAVAFTNDSIVGVESRLEQRVAVARGTWGCVCARANCQVVVLGLRSRQPTNLGDRVVDLELKKDIAQRCGRIARITIDTSPRCLHSIARRKFVGANPAVLRVERHQL